MNNTSNFITHPYDDAKHKPRISLFIDGEDRFYKCCDGGVAQFGSTPEEAFNNLKALR